jgi:hypothetical protein
MNLFLSHPVCNVFSKKLTPISLLTFLLEVHSFRGDNNFHFVFKIFIYENFALQ